MGCTIYIEVRDEKIEQSLERRGKWDCTAIRLLMCAVRSMKNELPGLE